MLNSEMDWMLISGATPKFDMLRMIAAEIGIDNTILQVASPVKIDEKNHFRSSKYIYTDKAEQIWRASAPLIGNNLGIMSDVHPKTKLRGTRQFLSSLVKYSTSPDQLSLNELPYAQRRELLAKYIASFFGSYSQEDGVDVRQSSGTVPFFSTAMIALIVQKTYIRYPTNPVPTLSAAKNLLDYSSEHSTDVFGKNNNLHLETSASSAGGILQSQLLEWYLQNNPHHFVVVDSTSNDPLQEINALGSGFTRLIVIEIARLTEKYKKPERIATSMLIKATIPLLPKKSFEIVWSRGDQRCIATQI